MITCREVTELFTEASEGTLRGWQKAQFRAHLLICGPCKCYRAQLETTVGTLSHLPREAASEELKQRLLDELRRSKKGVP